MEDGKVKTTFEKQEILEHIEEIEKSDIKIPEVITLLRDLKQQNIKIDLKDWTMKELVQKLVEKYRERNKNENNT